MTTEHVRSTRLFYVQPTMARLVAGAAALWGVGIPIVLAIKTGDPRLLLLAPLGLLLVPAALMLAAFGRIMLWVQLVLFWYIRGVVAVLAMLAFIPIAILILFTPAQAVGAVQPALDQLPTNVIAIGAVLMLMLAMAGGVLYIARRARADGGSSSRVPTIPPGVQSPAVPPLIPPTQGPRPLTYLEHRRTKTP